MFELHKVAYRHPKYKTAYRVKNWPEYEKSLRNRGDITVWFSQDAIEETPAQGVNSVGPRFQGQNRESRGRRILAHGVSGLDEHHDAVPEPRYRE